MTAVDTSKWCMGVPGGKGEVVCRCGGRVILQPGEVLDLDVIEVVRCSTTGALLGTISPMTDEAVAGLTRVLPKRGT